MSKRPQTPSQGGLLGTVALFCGVALLAGLAFDFVVRQRAGFWIGDQPGGMAAIGACAALFAVGAAHLARWLLARKTQAPAVEAKGGGDDASA